MKMRPPAMPGMKPAMNPMNPGSGLASPLPPKKVGGSKAKGKSSKSKGATKSSDPLTDYGDLPIK